MSYFQEAVETLEGRNYSHTVEGNYPIGHTK